MATTCTITIHDPPIRYPSRFEGAKRGGSGRMRVRSLKVLGGYVMGFRGGVGSTASIDFSIPCESTDSLLTASSPPAPAFSALSGFCGRFFESAPPLSTRLSCRSAHPALQCCEVMYLTCTDCSQIHLVSTVCDLARVVVAWSLVAVRVSLALYQDLP